MRNLTQQQQKLLSLPNYRVISRVFIQKADKTFQNICDLEGRNWLDSISYDSDIDQIVDQATISIWRNVYYLNMSPLVEKSKLNVDGQAVYKPLLELGRDIYIESAIVPEDMNPQESDWFEVFRGYIYDINPDANPFQLIVHDQSGKIRDKFIEDEKQYGNATRLASNASAGDQSIIVSDASNFTVGEDILIQESNTQEQNSILSISNDTIGLQDPLIHSYTADTEDGAMVLNTTPAETMIQNILNDNVPGTTLYCPVSPDFEILSFTQSKKETLNALDEIVKNFAWSLRQKWDDATSQFRLTLYEPERTKTTPDWTFEKGEYGKPQQIRLSLAGIRNKIKVTYSPDPANPEKRETVIREDADSIAKYGVRFMEVTEASTSQINTEDEAIAEAEAILADLKDPKAAMQIPLRKYFPFIELGDLIRFKANSIWFDIDQDLAVVSVSHEISKENKKTTLTVRGKPAGAYYEWLKRESKPGIAPPSQFPSKPILDAQGGLDRDQAFVSAYLDVSWQLNNANYHEIRYRKYGNKTWEKKNTQSNSSRISNLIANVKYEIQVRSIQIVGGTSNLSFISDWSDILAVTTPKDNQKPPVPVISEVKSTVRGLIVIMDESEADGTPRPLDFNRYNIYISTTNNFTPSQSNLEDSGNKSRFEITDKIAGEVYYIKVTSVDYSENESEPSLQKSQQAGNETISSTLVIAASNSSKKGKAGADFVCTGTNDEVIINKAMQSNSQVKFLEGTYKISETIKPQSNMKIDFGGDSTFFELQFDSSNSFGWFLELGIGVRNVTITGGRIDGTLATHSNFGNGVIIFGNNEENNILIENMNISNISGDGIFISSGSSYTAENIKISKCLIDNCEGSGIKTGNYSQDIIISNCTIQNCSDYGIYPRGQVDLNKNIIKNNYIGIYIDANPNGIFLDGGSIKNNTSVGVIILQSDDTKIINCNLSGNGFFNIDVSDSDNCYIFNNTCRANGITDTSIRIAGNKNYILLNNCLNGGLSNGILDNGTNTNFGSGNINNDGTFSTIPN